MLQLSRDISVYFHVHLVSDSTGETLVAMMKASCAQFRRATPLEHLHSLIRSDQQMEKTLEEIRDNPGIVLFTVADKALRTQLENGCKALSIPHVSILDPTLNMLGRYLGASISHEIAAQRTLDTQYYDRIAALDFAMAHDDGQNVQGLKDADIVLLGVSRTSKTPTCIYLANRGYKTGNIPLIPGQELPHIVSLLEKTFVVGLVASPDRIVQIREQRLMGLNETKASTYTDQTQVRDEMRNAKRMFTKNGFPTVDVTRRSIEETSARIINLYQIWQKNG